LKVDRESCPTVWHRQGHVRTFNVTTLRTWESAQCTRINYLWRIKQKPWSEGVKLCQFRLGDNSKDTTHVSILEMLEVRAAHFRKSKLRW